jgi:hypothetical protein
MTKKKSPAVEQTPQDLEGLLALLHIESVKSLLAKVKSGEYMPADMKNIIELLKHNKIDATPEANPELLELAGEIAGSIPFKQAMGE